MQSRSKKKTKFKKIEDALRKNLKKRKDFQNKLNNERNNKDGFEKKNDSTIYSKTKKGEKNFLRTLFFRI